MARDFSIDGEVMVYVKGPVGSAIATLSELGLSTDPVRVSHVVTHEPCIVDAWGRQPAEMQVFGGVANISMNLIHVDRAVLDECLRLSMGGPTTVGLQGRAGTRMGANAARFAAGNKYIGLNLTSPVVSLPYRFYFTYMVGQPIEHPMGTEKSVFAVTWQAISYTQDPYGGGTGLQNQPLWDRTLDT